MRFVIAAGSMPFSAKARQLYGVTKDELMHSAPIETSVPEATMPTPNCLQYARGFLHGNRCIGEVITHYADSTGQ